MKVERVEFRLIRMELLRPFETSFSVQRDRDVLLVSVEGEGLRGWGECTAGKDPYYSSETTAGALLMLRDFVIPGIRAGRIAMDAERYYSTAGFIRGNRMAHAAMEAALWHKRALSEKKSLSRLIGGSRGELLTGVSIGIQKDISSLVSVVEAHAAEGYKRIKIKIKPGWDVAPVAAIRESLGDIPLMADANCAYTLADLGTLRELDQFGLMMIEQPFAYTDFVDHARLQREISTPVCLDESITSLDSVRTALELNACRIINIKQGRVGGLSAAMAVHDLCGKAGIPVWAGGMLETGIGRALNISLASLENFSIPGDISASNRYWQRDVITPEVTFSRPGVIEVPRSAGLGYEIDMDYIESITTHKEVHELI